MQFEPYQGKQVDRPNSEFGLGASVILNLVKILPKNIPFKIYVDRFFSSLKLVDRITKLGYGYTGTVMKNRLEGCPISKGENKGKLSRGSFDHRSDTLTNCTITSWNDNRTVLLISSCDSVFPIGTASRWVSVERKKMPIPQPHVVSQYNRFMGGVDRMDENIENYRVSLSQKSGGGPYSAFVWIPVFTMHDSYSG
jgi:hypothetical protein